MTVDGDSNTVCLVIGDLRYSYAPKRIYLSLLLSSGTTGIEFGSYFSIMLSISCLLLSLDSLA